MEYKQYLLSDDWLTKRYKKKLRAKQCAICNSKDELHVHHLNYKNLVDVELSDLRVLCRRCHFLAHELHKAGKYKFRSTNHHSRFSILKAAVKKELGLSRTNMFKG